MKKPPNRPSANRSKSTRQVWCRASRLTSDNGAPITGYTVTSIPAGGVDSNAGATGLSHVVTGLANGTSYTFTVTATNAAGTSDPSAPSKPVTPNP